MRNRTIYAITALIMLFVLAWVLAAPTLGLPIGIQASDGPSMGDDPDSMYLNLWIDKEPEVGDVVFFEHGDDSRDRPILYHRIVEERSEGYATQGDANEFIDQDEWNVDYVTRENNIGVVVARINIIYLTIISSVIIIHSVVISKTFIR